MPDTNPSDPQAPAAGTNVQPGTTGDQPSAPSESTATTTTTDNPADPKPLSYEEAGSILDEADNNSARRSRDPLADSEDTSPLDDPAPADPLGVNELDELLPEETETPAGTTEEPQPAAEEPVAPSTEGEDEPEDHEALPKRIRLNLEQLNARDAAIILHARKTGKSLKEAEAELFGTSTPEPAKATETVTTPEPELASPDTILAEITELKNQRRKAATEFDQAAQIEITEKIEAAQERLTEARARQATETQRYQADFNQSYSRAEQAYADAFKAGTKLHDSILADKARLERVNPDFFNDPEWPETLVFKHAGKLGMTKAEAAKPTAEAPNPTPKPTAKPQPAKPARPVPGPAPGGRAATDTQSPVQAIRARLKAAEAANDGAAVDKILLELEQAQQAA